MAGHRYRFANCELSVSNRKLLVDGQPVDLQPRAFDLLLYLIEHAGRLVTKDELLDNVWGQRFVTESVVARMVMKVRKAIGDDAGDPRFILTQYGTGYRFVGEVERLVDAPQDDRTAGSAHAHSPLDEAPAESSAGSAPDGQVPRRLPVWRRYALPVAGVLAAVALLAMLLLPRQMPSKGLPRLAVLPVENATGDAALGWTELGLMTSIGDAVRARMPVDLIPAAEVLDVLRAVPGDALTPQRLEAVRSRLSADALVTGRLRRTDKEFGLEVGLFKQGRESPLAVLNDKEPAVMAGPAGKRIAEALAPALRRSVPNSRISSDPYINEIYARALDAMAREKFEEASEMLKVVVRKSGDEVDPRLRLAFSLLSINNYKEALEHASKIAEIVQPQEDRQALADAYIIASRAQYRLGDFDGAERYGQKALALASPQFPSIEPEAYRVLSVVMAFRNKLPEAKRMMEAVVVANQRMKSSYRLAAAHLNLGILSHNMGDVEAARRNLQRAIEFARLSGRSSIQIDAINRLATIEREQGDCRKAFEYLDASDAVLRTSGIVHVNLGNLQTRANCLSDLGKAREALTVVDEMDKTSKVPYDIAVSKSTRAKIMATIPAHSSAEVRSLFQQAEAIYKELGALNNIKATLVMQARYEIAHGRKKEAAAFLDQLQRLVEGENADDYPALQDTRGMAAYYDGDARSALEFLHKGARSSKSRDSAWITRTAEIAWVQLDLGETTAAAEAFGTVAPYEEGYTSVCLVAARLAYAEGKYREAADKQTACIKRLGEQVTPIEYELLDVYTAAAEGAARRPLPKVSPRVLW